LYVEKVLLVEVYSNIIFGLKVNEANKKVLHWSVLGKLARGPNKNVSVSRRRIHTSQWERNRV